jgi:hypothetical protein
MEKQLLDNISINDNVDNFMNLNYKLKKKIIKSCIKNHSKKIIKIFFDSQIKSNKNTLIYLHTCIIYNEIKFFKLIYNKSKINDSIINDLLLFSLNHKSFKIFYWLLKNNNINDELQIKLLKSIIEKGYYNLFQYFIKKFKNIDLNINNNIFFRSACICGHLKIAKWIYKNSNLTINIHMLNNEIFNLCFYNNHNHILRWLLSLTHCFNIETNIINSQLELKKLNTLNLLIENNININLNNINKELLFKNIVKYEYFKFARKLLIKNNIILDENILQIIFNNKNEKNEKLIDFLDWLYKSNKINIESLYLKNYLLNLSNKKNMLLIDWIIGKVNEKNNTINNNEYDIIEKDDLLLITKTIKKNQLDYDYDYCGLCLENKCNIYFDCQHIVCEKCIQKLNMKENKFVMCPYCYENHSYNNIYKIIDNN